MITVYRCGGQLVNDTVPPRIFRPPLGHFLNDFLNGTPGAILEQDNAYPRTARVAKTSYAMFRLCHSRPAPQLVPYRACVGSVETPDVAMSVCT